MIPTVNKQADKKNKGEAQAARLFGRDNELGIINNALQRLKGGRNDCILFSGPEGMGKSALLAYCKAEARKQGFLVYDGRADEAADSNPYQPVFRALDLAFGPGGEIVHRRAVTDTTKEFGIESMKRLSNIFNLLIPNPIGIAFEVRDMVRQVNDFNKEQRRAKEESSIGTPINRTFLAIHETLYGMYEASKRKPILLVIDDLQYARETTFKLLDALVTPTFPILLALGWDSNADNVPALLRTLVGRIHGELVKLAPLSHDDIMKVIDDKAANPRNIMVADDITRVREQIASFSAGFPGLVNDSVEYLAQGGDPAVFTASDESADDTAPGATLVGALSARHLDALSPDLRALLECAAVVGRRFPIELIISKPIREYQGLSGSRRTMLRQLAELAERKQIVSIEDGDDQMLTFTSRYIYNSLLKNLPQALLRSDHLELAQAWQELANQQGNLEAVAAELARHFFAAGQYQDAARYYLGAAGKLFNETAYSEAIEAYSKTLTCLEQLPLTAENLAVRGEVLTTRSLAHENLGENKDAIADLEAALPLAAVKADADDTINSPDTEPPPRQEAATAAAQPPELQRADLLGHLGWLYFKLGNYSKAATCFDECEQLYVTAGDLGGRVRVGVYRGSMLSQQRNFEAAIIELQGCLSLYAAHGISEAEVAAGLNAEQLAAAEDLDRVYLELGLVYNRMRKLDEAERYLSAALHISEDQGDRASVVQGKHYLGQCLSFQGKAEAIQYLTEAEQEAREQLKDRYLAASIGNTLAYAYQNLGQAIASAETFQKLIPELEGLGDSYGLGAAYGGLGGLYARMWKLDEALEYLQRDLDLVNADEQPSANLVSKLTNQIADLHRLKGDHEAAWASVTASRAAAARLGDKAARRHSEGFAALTDAHLHADAGEVDKAQAALTEAQDKLADIADTRAALTIVSGQLARLQKNWDEANRILIDNLKALWPGGDAYEIAITGLELTRLAHDMGEAATANKWANWTIERAEQLDNVALAQQVNKEIGQA
jgi:tetratricopeptide (TPR) repeat protein